jgi:hypothetical protein
MRANLHRSQRKVLEPLRKPACRSSQSGIRRYAARQDLAYRFFDRSTYKRNAGGRGPGIHAVDDIATTPLSREDREALCLVKAANQSRSSCGLIAPHLAWKESTLALVCYAIPAASVRREGRPVSGTGRPLVGAVRISAAVAIRRGRVVGVCVMGPSICHGAWRNADGECHDECNPGFGHHHEVPLEINPISEAFRRAAAREPLSRITALAELDELTLRPKIIV